MDVLGFTNEEKRVASSAKADIGQQVSVHGKWVMVSVLGDLGKKQHQQNLSFG